MWAIGQLRRSRRLILLFVVTGVLPAVIIGALIIRAVRNERLESAHQQAERQRQIVRLIEADLNTWLFSTRADSAVSQALFRFELEGQHVVFPEFQLSLPIVQSAARPFESAPPDHRPTAQVITDFYYPRILVFLRDFQGAQYFLRLRTLVVRLPDRDHGYALGAQAVLDHVNGRLVEFCAGENFRGRLSIGDLREIQSASGAASAFSIEGFSFFQVSFFDAGGRDAANLGRHAFAYSMGLLVLVTLVASVFVYRAVSQEVQLSQLRTDFVAAVSHEFRSPLSSILALSERLESARVPDPDKLTQYHRIIGQEARRLSTLVTRLLDFAQIEEGRKVYALERVELVGIVRGAIESFEHSVRPGRIRLDGEEAEPLWIRADRTAVSHCIQNLIENAVKYSPPDSPIVVTCASAGDFAIVDVRDHGIGVPPEEQSKIFEKFHRGRQAAGLDVQGVGIGLALVSHVVKSHGGAVSVESVPGEGSRFRVRLPKAGA